MNVTLPDNKLDKKSKIVYASIIAICIISIIIVIYIQFFDGKTVTTVGYLKGKSEIDYENLKAEFNNIYTNSLKNYNDKYDKLKSDTSKELVYTGYTKDVTENNSYNINVQIPYINIKNSTIDGYNEEIKNLFEKKAEDILKTKNKNTIYTVEYNACVEDGVLSIIINANLKEGSSAQRVIIKTYNYDLDTNQEINLSQLLKGESVDTSYAQSKINEEIEVEQKKAEDLKALGHSIFSRDKNDDMYKIENVEDFYFQDGAIYVIFAYGNDKYTSEVDVAII
ncbi:unknown [Clostridium sp. CAG:440]|jgi:hypothetical protein|nr:unknown [Clostridium sp. CAG:440]HJJ15670.1 hypothetical protein [Clostridiaceae bacterium]